MKIQKGSTKERKSVVSTTMLTLLIGFIFVCGIWVYTLIINQNAEIDKNSLSGLWTALSIIVALFAALFIWTALKESDFKEYKEKYSILDERMNQFSSLALLNTNLFKVERQFSESKEIDYDFIDTLVKLYITDVVSAKDIQQITNIIWSNKNEVDRAFDLRKQVYFEYKKYINSLKTEEITLNHYENLLLNAIDLCSVSNYITEKKNMEDSICDTTNINHFTNILFGHINTANKIEPNVRKRIWLICAIRLKKNAPNLLKSLFCYLKAIDYEKVKPNRVTYILRLLLEIKEFELKEYNGKIGQRVYSNKNLPISNNNYFPSDEDIKHFIIFWFENELGISYKCLQQGEMLSFVNNMDIIIDEFKTRFGIEKEKKASILFRATECFIQDFVAIYKSNGKKCENVLFKFIDPEIIAKRSAINSVNRSKEFIGYTILKKQYGENNIVWENLEKLYLTYYYLILTGDKEADNILKQKDNDIIEKMYKKIISFW